MDNRYLTSGKVARLVGVSKGTVLRAVQRGDLVPALKMPGGSLRFVPTAVDAYARTLGIELPAGAVRTSHTATPRRGRYAARRSAGAADPIYTWRTFSEAQPHSTFQMGVERLSNMDTSTEGADALVANVLALVAASLHAGVAGVSRESGGQWRIEHLHDRMGMGMAEGANDEFSAAFGTAAAPTGLEVLIVEDVRADARFPSLAGTPAGVSAFMAVQLSDANGRLVGTLFAAYPHVRAVNSDEISLLRLSGTIIMQFWELSAARQGRGDLLQSLADAKDRDQKVADLADQAVWQIGVGGETVLVNQRLASLLGFTMDELADIALLDLVDGDEHEYARERIESVRLGSGVRFDACLKRKDGTPLVTSVAMTPLFVAEGEYAGALALIAPSAAHDLYPG
jgi:PAS domain S-box-containing protein/excisionase family DNA binding protein